MNLDLAAVTAHLRETCCSISELRAPHAPGVYAIFARSSKAISPFPVPHEGLIYLGMSSDLASREFDHHFSSKRTGFSTLRRSLGAILREKLSLVPIPRSPGSKPNTYRFTAEGEDRLTDWMRENLKVGVCGVGALKPVEDRLIAELKPILNLTKWKNPYRKEIMLLRKKCARDAQQHNDGGA